MGKTVLIYGSTTGNTESVAKQIAKKLSDKDLTLIDVSRIKSPDELDKYDGYILGAPTAGYGDLQEDWNDFLPQLQKLNLADKKVAIFGLGDAAAYPETFVDGIGFLYDAIVQAGASVVGQVPTDDYEYDDSTAVRDGQFVGLPLDEDNDSDKTEERINSWIEKIKAEF
ncbi:MAG: flavodoxin [Prevotellaceae bacterium]|jgi:flavodoxin I|nr:flavodoxin [Prevotellaceae bacterium]